MLGVFGWIYHARSGITLKLKRSDSWKERARFVWISEVDFCKRLLQTLFCSLHFYYHSGISRFLQVGANLIQVSDISMKIGLFFILTVLHKLRREWKFHDFYISGRTIMNIDLVQNLSFIVRHRNSSRVLCCNMYMVLKSKPCQGFGSHLGLQAKRIKNYSVCIGTDGN